MVIKLHDIPNTVNKAMRVLSSLDVDMCNLHAGGTRRMMEAAVEGLTPRGWDKTSSDCGHSADINRSGKHGKRFTY